MKTISIMKNNFSDTMVMSGRMLRHNFRSVDTIITIIAMPIMIMLMFVYVFGGSIDTGPVDYINYVAPGIILMCISTGTAYTAFRLNNDVTKGIVERFRSMPIAKSSILGGHVLTSVVFNAFSTVMILLFSLIIGFRSNTGITGWLLATGILLLFTLAMTWIAVMFGLWANSAEGAGVYSYLLLGLLFISSGFAPTASMPRMVRLFAENQPMTPIIDSVRVLLLNKSSGNSAWIAVLWCSGLLIASYIASMQIYKHKTANT
jgi:ABC-2 type transport system permease protein